MNLTLYSDYSLRVLLYLSLRPDERVSIDEIASFYRISKDHLVKIVHHLGKLGYIQTIRGRNGGIELAKDPGDITIGEIVRKTEPNFNIVECFHPETNHCAVTGVCRLKIILSNALDAFLSVLDQYTLQDMVANPDSVLSILNIED